MFIHLVDLASMDEACGRAAVRYLKRSVGDVTPEAICMLSRDQVATLKSAVETAFKDWLRLHAARTGGGQWMLRVVDDDTPLEDASDDDVILTLVADEVSVLVLHNIGTGHLSVVPQFGRYRP